MTSPVPKVRASKVSIEEILEACFRKSLIMRTRPRPSGNAARCGGKHEVRAYTKNNAGKVSAHFARIIKHTTFYAVCKEKITW